MPCKSALKAVRLKGEGLRPGGLSSKGGLVALLTKRKVRPCPEVAAMLASGTASSWVMGNARRTPVNVSQAWIYRGGRLSLISHFDGAILPARLDLAAGGLIWKTADQLLPFSLVEMPIGDLAGAPTPRVQAKIP